MAGWGWWWLCLESGVWSREEPQGREGCASRWVHLLPTSNMLASSLCQTSRHLGQKKILFGLQGVLRAEGRPQQVQPVSRARRAPEPRKERAQEEKISQNFQKLKRSTWKKIITTLTGTMMSIMLTERSTLTSTLEDPTVATSPWYRQKVSHASASFSFSSVLCVV